MVDLFDLQVEIGKKNSEIDGLTSNSDILGPGQKKVDAAAAAAEDGDSEKAHGSEEKADSREEEYATSSGSTQVVGVGTKSFGTSANKSRRSQTIEVIFVHNKKTRIEVKEVADSQVGDAADQKKPDHADSQVEGAAEEDSWMNLLMM